MFNININFLHLLSSNFFVRGISFLGQLLIVFVLSPEVVASIKTATVYVDILVNIAVFGFSASILKVNGVANHDTIKIDAQIIIVATTSLSILTSFTLYLLAETTLLTQSYETKTAIQMLCLTVLPISLIAIQSSLLQSLGMFKTIANVQMVTKLISVTLLIILSYFFGFEGYVVAAYLAHLFTSVLLFRSCKEYISWQGVNRLTLSLKGFYQRHFPHAFYSCLAYLMSILTRFMPLIVMNVVGAPLADIGVFSIALTIVMTIDIFSSTIQQYVTPKLSKLVGDKSKYKYSYNIYNRVLVISVLLLGLTLSLAVYLSERYFLSEAYRNLSFNVLLLSVSWVIQSTYFLKGPSLLVLGKSHLNASISAFSCLISIPFSFWFIENFNDGHLLSRLATSLSISVFYFITYKKVTSCVN